MAKMTSAYANKLLKQLQEDKEYWMELERTSSTYIVSKDEKPVIPEYDYTEVAGNISEIDEKICRLKHAINVANTTNKIDVGTGFMSIDVILVRMAQLNKRRETLDNMRKMQPVKRITEGDFLGSRTVAPEYKYINYDLKLIKKEYERISEEIMMMQIALDRYNQTVEFEVEL